ncbi:hypothetical protein ABTY59_33780 [Streptomyces sp. NPDC096079]|uniref:hypothetical protein n=1 Tax=Streptomyces sp. NPDC096079 TaxID=3155820 RepID=UPI003320BEAF
MSESTTSGVDGREPAHGRVKTLLWRAALGAAYAVGAGVVTFGINWVAQSLL